MDSIISFPKGEKEAAALLSFLKKNGIAHNTYDEIDSVSEKVRKGLDDYKKGGGERMSLNEFLEECK